VSRPARIGLIVLGVVLFLAVSAVIARFLGAATAERDRATGILRLQARGDVEGVVNDIEGCRADPSCVSRIVAQVKRLRTPGRFEIVRVENVAGLAIGSRTDTARVVWRAGSRLPTVQCVRVRRSGNPISGYDVDVLALGAPIGRESSCPG
jgi:hypothetical protein